MEINRLIFWKVFFWLYSALGLAGLYAASQQISTIPIDAVFIIFLSTASCAPIFGLAYSKKIISKELWFGFFIINVLSVIYVAVFSWVPAALSNQPVPAFVILLTFFSVWGNALYVFAKNSVWNMV
jgi:hypothetical protein